MVLSILNVFKEQYFFFKARYFFIKFEIRYYFLICILSGICYFYVNFKLVQYGNITNKENEPWLFGPFLRFLLLPEVWR